MSTKWKQFGIDIKLTYKPMQADLHGHQIIYYIFYFNTTILFNISFIQFYFNNNLLLILDVPLRDIMWAGPLWAPPNLAWLLDGLTQVRPRMEQAGPRAVAHRAGPIHLCPRRLRELLCLFFRESNHFFNFFIFPAT